MASTVNPLPGRSAKQDFGVKTGDLQPQSTSRSLLRTASSSSSQSIPSANSSMTPVEQTASVDLISHGSILRLKTCRSVSPHFLVLGTDRLLLYTDVIESGDELFTSRPGTADSLHSLHSLHALRPSSAITGKSLSMAPTISITASVGSPGELKLRGYSDDEENEESVVDGREAMMAPARTRCRVAVSINQLVDVVVIDDKQGSALLVVYCPSTNKLNDPYSFKALTTTLSQSFRKRPEKMLREVLQQYPDDSYHFYVRMGSKEAADQMKGAVLEQARKFYEIMVWLSKGFGVPKCDSSVVMLTTTTRCLRSKSASSSTTTYGSSAFPGLGDAVGLPVEVSEGMCGLARGEIPYGDDAIVMTYYLETPVGMATVELGLMDLERSFVDGSAPVEVVGQLRDAKEEEGDEYCWEVTLTFRAVRGGTSIGKSSAVNKRTTDKDNGAERSSLPSQSETLVRRRQSHGLSAPLAVSLVALRAAREVMKGVSGGNKKKRSKKSKKATGASPKISPTNLYEWSLVTLGIDVSLAPKKSRAGNVARMVSTTHCLDDVNTRLVAGTRSSQVDLPPAFETLMERYASIVTPDVATRFLIGLDTEAKAYTGLIKMVEFWTKHNLSELRPNPLAFQSMKRHYPHGVIGWSDKSDCLITFEAMGKWPDAYKCVLEDGVSEDAILHHMLVCYLFNFQVLDDRAWPNGKAVKIMDLDGLRLGHINSAGFKFITSIANVLAIMFPQRMHQCIFINAPSFWNVAWSVMKNVVPEKVRNQMQVFNRGSKDKARAALLEYLHEDELGSLFPEPALLNEYERRLIDYVEGSTGS